MRKRLEITDGEGQPRDWHYRSFEEGMERMQLPESKTRATEIQGLPEIMRADFLRIFYEGQINKLPPQQQKILITIANAFPPVQVSELVDRTQIHTNTLTNALKELREHGYVTSYAPPTNKRVAIYEVKDPGFRQYLVWKYNPKLKAQVNAGKIATDAPRAISEYIDQCTAPSHEVMKEIDGTIDALRAKLMKLTARQLRKMVHAPDTDTRSKDILVKAVIVKLSNKD